MVSNSNFSRRITTIAGAFLFVWLTATYAAFAQTETILYNFCALSNCADGQTPETTLIRDAAGNLYGTTMVGGKYGSGTVFKLSPSGVLTPLHNFGASSTDGNAPMGEIVRDTEGNIYGTTLAGGPYRLGTVFRLSPEGTETILHSFGGVAVADDGVLPFNGVVADAQGNLYGTTPGGGRVKSNPGTVFKLNSSGTYSVLHHFSGDPDGLRPEAPVTVDGSGNLYGVTSLGGENGVGSVFGIAANGTEQVLHSFSATGGGKGEGAFPWGGLAIDSQGNLYGTTYDGGAFHTGVVFKLAPDGTETVLHSFGGSGDGIHTASGLLLDAQGNVYGTCFQGGLYGGGVVFKIAPDGTETILHNFGNGTDGKYPQGGLFMDSLGNIYGTTELGGTGGGGTVFEVTP